MINNNDHNAFLHGVLSHSQATLTTHYTHTYNIHILYRALQFTFTFHGTSHKHILTVAHIQTIHTCIQTNTYIHTQTHIHRGLSVFVFFQCTHTCLVSEMRYCTYSSKVSGRLQYEVNDDNKAFSVLTCSTAYFKPNSLSLCERIRLISVVLACEH